MVFFGGIAQIVEDHTRLYSCNPMRRIDFHDVGHVLTKIEHHGNVTTLSGERSSSAAAENGCAEFTGERDGRDDVINIARNNDSDRNLTIVGAIGGVKRAAAVIKAHFRSE